MWKRISDFLFEHFVVGFQNELNFMVWVRVKLPAAPVHTAESSGHATRACAAAVLARY